MNNASKRGHFRDAAICVLKRGQVQNFLVKTIFYYHANKSRFHKKGFALVLVLRVRDFGSRKWPIKPLNMRIISRFSHFFHFNFFLLLQIVNNEMFWVVTEICSEANLVKRMKLIKAFIKIASE